MGENQSKPSGYQPAPTTGRNDYNPPNIYSYDRQEPQQQQQRPSTGLSDEEVRKRRLAKMYKPPEWRDRPKQQGNQANGVFKHPLAQNNDNVFLPENHVGHTGAVQRDLQEQITILQREEALKKEVSAKSATHPVNQSHGKEAYIIHASIEDLLEVTIYNASLVRNSKLRVLKMSEGDEKRLQVFTIENFSEVIEILIGSQDYIPRNERFAFLCKVLSRLDDLDQSSPIDKVGQTGLRKTLNSFLTTFIECPQIYCTDYKEEDIENPLDFSCKLYDDFYAYAASNEKGDFLTNLVADLDPENFNVVFTPLFKRIIKNSTSATLEDTQKLLDAVQLFEEILQTDKKFIEFLVVHTLFLPKNQAITGLTLQKLTIFGSFLSLTSQSTETTWVETFFADPNKFTVSDKDTVKLRTQIHDPINILQRIMEYMMRADQKFKQSIIEWFYRVIESNESKSQDAIRKSACTNGWYINFFLLLLKLSEKVLEDPSKYPNWFSKISLQYLKEKPIFNHIQLLNGQFNICNDSNLLAEKPKHTFLTELIFLTSHALSGFNQIIKPYDTFMTSYHMQMIQLKEGSPEHWKLYGQRKAFELQLIDPYIVAQTLKLMTFQSFLILHSYDLSMANSESSQELFEATTKLNNSDFQDKLSLPLYWGENIHSYMMFTTQTSHESLLRSREQLETIMMFILGVVSNPSWIPHIRLRASLMTNICRLTPRNLGESTHDYASFIFKHNQYFERNLPRGIIQMCTELEILELKSPYERFFFTSQGCYVLHYLAKSLFAPGKVTYLGTALEKMTQDHREVFLKFAKIFLDDMIFLMNDSFIKLKQIKTEEDDLVNPGLMSLLSPMEKFKKQISTKTWAKQVEALLIYVNTYFEMSVWLTSMSREIFEIREVQQLLAATLNFCLSQLIGPNAQYLNVKDMKNLKIDQKGWIILLVQTYLNFWKDDKFVAAVVRDKRSFSIDIFKKTMTFISKFAPLSGDDITNFAVFVGKLGKRTQEKKAPEAPKPIPEFIDPITKQIMTDPVLLPTSDRIVDRTTILKHLANRNTDPFNGAELTQDVLIPQEALKMLITEFLEGNKELYEK